MKFSFSSRHRKNDIHLDKLNEKKETKNKINKLKVIQLEEPKEESFHFISPRKSAKITLEQEDDIFKTEMNNKKPIELFQDNPKVDSKIFELKNNNNKKSVNEYDSDCNITNFKSVMDKSNISESFNKIINQNNSIIETNKKENDLTNDKIDETTNTTLKNNTIDELRNNNGTKDYKKLIKFCRNMLNKNKGIKIYNMYPTSQDININDLDDKESSYCNINNNDDNHMISPYKTEENFNSYYQRTNDKNIKSPYNNIKSKLIKNIPLNKTYVNEFQNNSNLKYYNQMIYINKTISKNKQSKISFEDSLSYFNKTHNKFYSSLYTNRSHSLINKTTNNNIGSNSLFIKSNNKNKFKALSHSKFIYKKQIIKKNKDDINNIIISTKDEKIKNKILKNKSFKKEKYNLNTFRINIKSIKKKENKKEKEKPINFKNNIIIQNFNNYNLNSYNTAKNIDSNFIKYDTHNNCDKNKNLNNKKTEKNNSARNSVVLDIKINKRCFSKNSERKFTKYIL